MRSVVVFVLTGFADARTTSEIRGLELRPEPMPRAFLFRGLLESKWSVSSNPSQRATPLNNAGPTAHAVNSVLNENRLGNSYRPLIYWMSPWSLLNAFSSSSIWPPTVKLAGFWRGGNSLNVARNLPTYACAGTRT
jgi:hypothetical protein